MPKLKITYTVDAECTNAIKNIVQIFSTNSINLKLELHTELRL